MRRKSLLRFLVILSLVSIAGIGQLILFLVIFFLPFTALLFFWFRISDRPSYSLPD